MRKLVATIICCVALAACGRGGSSNTAASSTSSSETPTTNPNFTFCSAYASFEDKLDTMNKAGDILDPNSYDPAAMKQAKAALDDVTSYASTVAAAAPPSISSVVSDWVSALKGSPTAAQQLASSKAEDKVKAFVAANC